MPSSAAMRRYAAAVLVYPSCFLVAQVCDWKRTCEDVPHQPTALQRHFDLTRVLVDPAVLTQAQP